MSIRFMVRETHEFLTRSVALMMVLFLCMVSSGCVTTLGYYPEYIKQPSAPTPTLPEVRKWATDVMDGYDSRATMNRYSLYGGALVAAAGMSALAGLAAFDASNAAMTGIPLGTGFLSAVATIYQSEQKAAIYRRGCEHLRSLILLSDKRVTRYRQDILLGTHREVEGARKAVEAAEGDLKQATARAQKQSQEAQEARKKVDSATKGTGEREALEKSAKALEDLAAKEKASLKTAEAVLAAARERQETATLRDERRKELLITQSRQEVADTLVGLTPDKMQSEFYMSEANCLREDVEGAMNKVSAHLEMLDPKNLADRLSAVKASETGSGGDDNKTKESQLPPLDLSDLPLPAKSACGP